MPVCTGITREGRQCKKNGSYDGRCHHHWHQTEDSSAASMDRLRNSEVHAALPVDNNDNDNDLLIPLTPPPRRGQEVTMSTGHDPCHEYPVFSPLSERRINDPSASQPCQPFFHPRDIMQQCNDAQFGPPNAAITMAPEEEQRHATGPPPPLPVWTTKPTAAAVARVTSPCSSSNNASKSELFSHTIRQASDNIIKHMDTIWAVYANSKAACTTRGLELDDVAERVLNLQGRMVERSVFEFADLLAALMEEGEVGAHGRG
ncbi:hypothetical protein IWZ03DRAFT_427563 [Phyllosticta citriasiana]|uniref:Uncharacterized protein n=1 Tax=Phyllosticta citriasiana TaxID=595635 RepID=A0ABR1K766_9PEZI